MDKQAYKESCSQQKGCRLECTFCQRIMQIDKASLQKERDILAGNIADHISNTPAGRDKNAWDKHDNIRTELEQKRNIIINRISKMTLAAA